MVDNVKCYINTQFANDPKNDLTNDELNSLGVPELALLMLVRGNDGNDYCAMIQLLLTSGSSFFE